MVIIDELGRGTSTFDGTAIAYATLRYLAEQIKCLSFFVTHFPVIGSVAATHRNVGNSHVSYLAGEGETLTFLFRVEPGLETRSYGLNVARMAFGGSFDSILERAAMWSKQMESRQQKAREDEFLSIVKSIQN